MSSKMLSNLLKVTSIALVTATAFFCLSDREAVYAQRSAGLFSMCQQGGAGDSYAYDVIIGREMFTSIGSISAYGGNYTCRIRPGNSAYKYKMLRLAFGVQDTIMMGQCSRPVIVNVYLDGNLEASRSLEASEKALLLLDVSRTSSVQIDVPTVQNGTCFKTVNFTQAILEPISSSPGRRY